jgi:cobalt transporter subunit CbtA
MLQRLLLTGLLSGAIAGVVLTIVHLTAVQPLIVKAEIYEKRDNASGVNIKHAHQGGLDHIHAGGSVPHVHEKNHHVHPEGISHAHTEVKPGHIHPEQLDTIKHKGRAHSDQPHAHSGNIWSPKDGVERSLYSLAANVLTAVAYGLLLVSGFTLYGGMITLHRGLLWGGAGFVCFSFLPGLGLPPELPASAAGDLLARQIWWLGTAAASVAGLSLLVFSNSIAWRVVGLLLLVIPHAVGAPPPEVGAVGPSSPELAAHFVMLALFASAIMWAVLGVVAAFFFDKFSVESSTSYTRVQTN